MTKLRTINQLQDALDHDFAWRLKEVDDLRKAARGADASRKRTFMRAGVALLYAHWEGFVKATAQCYINYLSCQGIPYRDLRPCFIALGMKARLLAVADSGKAAVGTSAVEFILGELDKPAKLPLKGSVDTESNLGSTVFQNIAGWIGVDTAHYETKFHLVDESLLCRRNRIAHGEFLDIDATGFDQLVDDVLLLMRWFKTDVENAAALGSHLAA